MILVIIFIILLVFTGVLSVLVFKKKEEYDYAADYDKPEEPGEQLVAGTVWTSNANQDPGLGWVL